MTPALGSVRIQCRSEFFFIALIIEFQQAIKHGTTGGRTDCEPDPLFRFVKAVLKDKISPVIGDGDRVIRSTCNALRRWKSSESSFSSWKRLYVLVNPSRLASIAELRACSWRSPIAASSVETVKQECATAIRGLVIWRASGRVRCRVP